MRAKSMINSYQILRGDQTGCEENICRVHYAPSLENFMVTRMPTRDLFAVANLVKN